MSPTRTAPIPLDHSALPRTAPYPFISSHSPQMRASFADVRSIWRVTSGCGGLKRKANVAAESSPLPRSTPSKKKQRKSAPLEPPQESCSRCGGPIVLKVTSKSEKNKGKRYWSCQARSQEGHFFEWWRVPGDLATRLSKPDLMQFAQAMGADPPKSATRERIVDHIKQIQYAQ